MSKRAKVDGLRSATPHARRPSSFPPYYARSGIPDREKRIVFLGTRHALEKKREERKRERERGKRIETTREERRRGALRFLRSLRLRLPLAPSLPLRRLRRRPARAVAGNVLQRLHSVALGPRIRSFLSSCSRDRAGGRGERRVETIGGQLRDKLI